MEVRLSTPTTSLLCLAANHVEAETRIVLHAINASNKAVVVSARGTNVLVSHFCLIQCIELWMEVRTAEAKVNSCTRYCFKLTSKLSTSPDSFPCRYMLRYNILHIWSYKGFGLQGFQGTSHSSAKFGQGSFR